MQMKQIVATFVAGFILVALGLRPAPLYGLEAGIHHFRALFSPFLAQSRREAENGKRLAGRIWLVASGTALIVTGLLAYISS